MTTFRYFSIISVLSLLVVPTLSNGASTRTGDESTTSSSSDEGMSLKILSRTTNSWGQRLAVTSGDDDTSSEGRFNYQDCLDRDRVSFRFEITVGLEDIDVISSEITVFVCSTVEASEACSRYKVTESGIYSMTLAKLFDISDDSQCTGEGEYYIWAAKPNNSDWWPEPSTDPAVILYDMEAPEPPTLISAGPGENKATLTWASDTASVDILYYPGDGKVIVDEDTDGDEDTEASTDIEIDTEVPDADGGVAPDAGDSSTDNTDDINAAAIRQHTYAATKDDTDEDNADDEDADEDEEITCPEGGFEQGDTFSPDGDYGSKNSQKGNSGTVTGLVNGQVYKFGLVAKDRFLNRSVISETACVMPNETEDFWEIYNKSGGKGGKYCFIATAAFGSYDHPMVKLLRGFRDRFLAQVPFGGHIIQSYYAVGPSMAQVVGESNILRAVLVVGLSLFALFTIPFTILTPIGTLLGLFLVMGGAVYRRRRRRS